MNLYTIFLAEHMLFYASEKYPLEDSYSKYITEVSKLLFTEMHLANCTFIHACEINGMLIAWLICSYLVHQFFSNVDNPSMKFRTSKT